MLKKIVVLKLKETLNVLGFSSSSSWEVSIPVKPEHGDFASNVALVLAKAQKMNPREMAQKIVDGLGSSDVFESITIAGPGFINFKLTPKALIEALQVIAHEKKQYGICKDYQGKKVLVEFVSANPTGPLHIGHGRNAVVGDTLSRLMQAVGYEAKREYYINDGGIPMMTLGKPVYLRMQELQGEKIIFPENAYQGEYITDLAKDLLKNNFNPKAKEESDTICELGRIAGDRILEEIKDQMTQAGVLPFDTYFMESSLYQSGEVQKILEELKTKGFTYENEGALWLKSTQFGDDKDRVLIKSDGSNTYLTPDIAYHQNKYARGYDRMINIWGADHAGYAPRLKSALKVLGLDESKLSILLIQMVSLVRDGEQIAMSTRRAQYETLENVIGEVGRDVARYFFMMRSFNAQLDFDLELAKKQTSENPVYYIQYAHARISSIFAKAIEEGIFPQNPFLYQKEYVSFLQCPEELSLARTLLNYPATIKLAAEDLAPHRVAYYLLELARSFQSYYDRARNDSSYRILTGDKNLIAARLFFLSCLKQVLQNGLEILGIGAPERM